jgi:enoyl-CoA hydratase
MLFNRDGRTGWIYFDRTERMNALAPQTLRELWSLLGKIEADTQVRVAIFTGKGEAFCAGMDMAGLEKSSALVARRRSREIQMLTNRIAELSIPTIAAVNGVAMGAGLDICLACDLVIASSEARFAFPEVRLGMIPCGGGTQRLARLIGLRRAREMILTGRILNSEQALAWGLINEVVAPGELLQEAEGLAERLLQGGRFALFQAKRCLNRSLDMDASRGMEYETECFTTCFSTGEPASGLRRFAAQEREPGEGISPADEAGSQGQSEKTVSEDVAPAPQATTRSPEFGGPTPEPPRELGEEEDEVEEDEDKDIWE